jgi:NAD(P)-dependent dehydrogenase (short-subunit alcohol dehydrogenase family)
LALQGGIETIYMACRNEDKAKAAKLELERTIGKSIFEIILMDVSNLDSVKQAVSSLNEPIDALVMNAGGLGGKDFLKQTNDGVSQITASNLLGHVLLTEELLDQKKLTGVALYAGSEGARGAPKIRIPRPELSSGSVEEFTAICDGSSFGPISGCLLIAWLS